MKVERTTLEELHLIAETHFEIGILDDIEGLTRNFTKQGISKYAHARKCYNNQVHGTHEVGMKREREGTE